jgi:hypothetical protein
VKSWGAIADLKAIGPGEDTRQAYSDSYLGSMNLKTQNKVLAISSYITNTIC